MLFKVYIKIKQKLIKMKIETSQTVLYLKLLDFNDYVINNFDGSVFSKETVIHSCKDELKTEAKEAFETANVVILRLGDDNFVVKREYPNHTFPKD